MAIQTRFFQYTHILSKPSAKLVSLLVVLHALLLTSQLSLAGPERYKAKSYNQESVKFYGRYGADLVNWRYIRADIVGQVKKAIREGENVLGELDQYVATNANGSVFILPGVDADELVVINDGSGNPIVIRR